MFVRAVLSRVRRADPGRVPRLRRSSVLFCVAAALVILSPAVAGAASAAGRGVAKPPPADLLEVARKPILAAGLMGAALFALRNWNVLLVMIAAAAIYATALLLLRTFSGQDLDAARDLFHSFRKAGVRRLASDSEGS